MRYNNLVAISLALTVIGAIIVFATHGVKLTAFPWLDPYAAGWVMLIVGAITFVIGAASAHNSGWLGRFFGRGEL